MLKKIEYEAKNIEEVILDLADEIKNGWKIHTCGMMHMDFSAYGEANMSVEVTMCKRC